MVFREAPLSTVRAELRRWYGVELRIADATLAGRHLTAEFSGEPVDQVQRAIAPSLGAELERRGDTAIVDGGPIPTPADSALLAARGSADRASVRLSSVARFGTDDRRAGALTIALDHSRLHESTASAEMHAGPSVGGTGPNHPPEIEAQHFSARRTTSGITGQADLSFRNTVFLTGGVRLERTSGFSATSPVSTLPLLGAAFVVDRGGMTFKLRSAYGKGIRPVQTTVRSTGWILWHPGSIQNLAPEEQVGVEVGADLLFGRGGVFRITRFDQRASGLIQPVAVSSQDPLGNTASHTVRAAYHLQNVGEISNRGWELEGSTTLGRFALGGALALVDSRVERTALGYTGDLRRGDRVLEVPARTLSLNASWLGSSWSTTWGVTRASDWINYDRAALNEAALDPNRSPRDFVGAILRSYWREYDGVTRLHATLQRHLTRGLSLVFTGDNLLGYQEGEPDNITVLPGRTVTAGVRVKF
ncbi:MAG: TonB-dependent receptor domain-containing protein [Gemmatimonadaceae bacterium]